MRRLLPLAAALAVAACAPAARAAGDAPVLVLRGVTLIDGTGAPARPGVDVVIEGERIREIRESGGGEWPRGATVLELPGRWVMPGLIDTHAHVTVLRWVPDGSGRRRGVYDRGVSERALRVLLAHGVTAVRNPSAPAAEGVALREAVARGEIPGPRIITSGEHLADSRMSEEEIRAEVRRQIGLGVDLIKVYSNLPPPLVRAAIEEAHAHGVPVVGHLQRTTWTEAARLGIDAITHGAPWSPEYLPAERRPDYRQTLRGRLDWIEWLELDGPEVREMIEALVAHRVPVDPTLIAYHTKHFGDDPRWLQHPEQQLVPEIVEDWRGGTHTDDWTAADHARARRLWPKLAELVRRYHAAGVRLSAGSDMPVPWVIPGVSLHEELELLVEAGIPPLEVLTIATRNGAETLGLLDEIGSVEVGKRADLLVLAADPVADIRNTRRIERVIQGGRVLRPAELLADPAAGADADAGAGGGRVRAAAGGLHAARVAVPIPGRTDTASLLLYLPRGHADGGLWPTVLYLHGGSQRGTDLERVKSYGPARLAAEGHELPFILVAPQIGEGEIWSDADALVRLLDELAASHPIDPDRVYVTGTSMGGRGAWYLAYRHPERFAAIAPVAAFQPIAHWAASGRLGTLPVLALHGERDEVAPVAQARRMHEALRAAGGSSELRVLPGRDHFIADVLEDPELYDWLLRHRRAPRGSP